MNRVKGWENRLIKYLNYVATQPFEYGKLDCALFFSGAVEAMTGIDPAAKHRGKYKTLKGGIGRMMRAGFADHAEFYLSLYPAYENRLTAKRGDGAILRDLDGNPAMGIVQGEKVYIMSADGLALRDLIEIEKALQI